MSDTEFSDVESAMGYPLGQGMGVVNPVKDIDRGFSDEEYQEVVNLQTAATVKLIIRELQKVVGDLTGDAAEVDYYNLARLASEADGMLVTVISTLGQLAAKFSPEAVEVMAKIRDFYLAKAAAGGNSGQRVMEQREDESIDDFMARVKEVHPNADLSGLKDRVAKQEQGKGDKKGYGHYL